MLHITTTQGLNDVIKPANSNLETRQSCECKAVGTIDFSTVIENTNVQMLTRSIKIKQESNTGAGEVEDNHATQLAVARSLALK